MRSLAISEFTIPANYDWADLPDPSIMTPDDVLIRVHAAGINPVDVKKAAGAAKRIEHTTFPYKIGYDLSGTIIGVGAAVTRFTVGDEIYSRLPQTSKGSISEFAVTGQQSIALKPSPLSHVQAASLPLVAIKSFQALEKANDKLPGGLKGRTIFIPGGLSGIGSIALQLAKRVYGASRVITTVSTPKLSQIRELLGHETVDQVIDYTTQNILEEIGIGSVDFMLDTMGDSLQSLAMMRPGVGYIISISGLPSGSSLLQTTGPVPLYIRFPLDVLYFLSRFKAWRAGVTYEYLGIPSSGEDLERVSEFIANGQVKPIVGRIVMSNDLAGIREGCTEVFNGRGGVGKMVIKMI